MRIIMLTILLLSCTAPTLAFAINCNDLDGEYPISLTTKGLFSNTTVITFFHFTRGKPLIKAKFTSPTTKKTTTHIIDGENGIIEIPDLSRWMGTKISADTNPNHFLSLLNRITNDVVAFKTLENLSIMKLSPKEKKIIDCWIGSAKKIANKFRATNPVPPAAINTKTTKPSVNEEEIRPPSPSTNNPTGTQTR